MASFAFHFGFWDGKGIGEKRSDSEFPLSAAVWELMPGVLSLRAPTEVQMLEKSTYTYTYV